MGSCLLSYKANVIEFARFGLFLFSYPLVHMQLPGNAPLEYATPLVNYSLPMSRMQTEEAESDVHEAEIKKPRWVSGSNCFECIIFCLPDGYHILVPRHSIIVAC